MCHLALGSLVIEAMQQAVAIRNMNESNSSTSWHKLRVWNTHVDDYSNGWRDGVKYFTRSSACERPTLVESFICCWVGLGGSYGQVKFIAIGGFERRYDPNGVKKGFVNNN